MKKFNLDIKKLLDFKYIPLDIIVFTSIAHLFRFNAFFTSFSDEYDNILGGFLIGKGIFPYTGFFSHHMPFAYYYSYLLTLVSGENLIILRIAYNLSILALLIFAFYYLFSKTFGRLVSYLLILTYGVVSVTWWTNLILAETFVGFSTIICLSIIIFKFLDENHKTNRVDLLIFSIMAFVPVLSGLTYIFISFILFFFYIISLSLRKIRNVKGNYEFFEIFIYPFIFPFIFLVSLGSIDKIKTFIFEAYSFNSRYYSQFTNDANTSIFGLIKNTFKLISVQGVQALSLEKGVLPFLALVSVVLLIIILLIKKQFIKLTLILSILFFSVTRGDIINRGLIGGFDGAVRLGIIYNILIIYLIGLVIYEFSQISVSKPWLKDLRNLIITAGICVFIFIIGFKGLELKTKYNNYKNGIQGNTLDKFYHKPSQVAININNLLKAEEYYWVGPFDFYSQIFIESKLASKYTFFLPWHNVCTECKKELISDFEENKPELIYIEPGFNIWHIKADDYYQAFSGYVEKSYVEAKSIGLPNYYFRKDGRLIDKLEK